MKLLPVLALSITFSYSSTTLAHARWAEGSEGGITPARSSSAGLKTGPCGQIEREDDANRPATVLTSGSVVSLKIYQSIFHQGDYRVYFSEKNDEGLFVYNRASAEIVSTPTDENTLVSPGELIDQAGQAFYEVDVTLPNLECDDCVLQLIQYMPNNLNNPYYYSCADIILTTDGSNPTDPVDTTPPDPVSNFEAIGGDSQAILEWINPSTDFTDVVLLQSDNPVPDTLQSGIAYSVGESIGDAKVVYRGRATSQIVDGLVNGSTYYFALYTSDDNLNYSTGESMTLQLDVVSVNSKPLVSLVAEQDTIITEVFKTDEGEVLIQANVDDENTQDNHSFDWSATSAILIDTDTEDSTFTFDPSNVDAGNYLVVVNVQDDGAPPLNDVAFLNISIEQSVIDPSVPEEPEPAPEPTPEPTPEEPITIDPSEPVNETEEEGAGVIHYGLLLWLFFFRLLAGSVNRLFILASRLK